MSTTVVTRPPQPVRPRTRPAQPLAEETNESVVTRSSMLRWALCAVPMVAMLVFWAADDGGYNSVIWLASGLALTALAIFTRGAFGPRPRLGRYGRFALVALALYVVWSYASIAWAVDKGAALLGSDRALLYLVLFWLITGLEWTRRRLELGMTLYLFGIGAVAAATLVELAISPTPQLLQGGQLAATLGYHNATAALGTIGALGAILIGSSGKQLPVVRAGLAAVAVLCLEVSLLANSRGWLYTLPVIVAVLFALAPNRGRMVLWALIPICCTLATLPWVAHSWALSNGAALGHQTVAGANETTARAGLGFALVSASLGLVLASVQGRFELSRRGRRWVRRVSRAFAALTVVGLAAGAIVAIHSGALARGWHQFTTNAPLKAGVSRFSELGSERYDAWRVSVNSFAAHPVGGLGQDNFAQAYVVSRRTNQEPLWVHSLELRLLAHTGIVGFLLFCAFLICAAVACRRAGRLGSSRLRLALVAAVVPVTVWVIHGSVDWFWEMPALSGAALVFLAGAVAMEPPSRPRHEGVEDAPRHWSGRGWRALLGGGRAAGAVVTAAAALFLFGTGYLGERALAQGGALASTRPASALHELALAAKLEPYSSAPFALGAGLELRAGHAASALQWAGSGLNRDSGDWVLWLEDGLAEGLAGQPAAEHAALAHAHALDPREPVITLAQRRAGTAHPLTIAQAASMFAGRVRARVAP